MAGHSKWANIKHRKASQDARRGKLYTRLIREITVAVRSGSALVEDNSRLRLAVSKALAANMPRGTIDRAIDRGAGTGADNELIEVLYEGYAPGGVAVMLECVTDNRNRTVAEVRHLFGRYGGQLGTEGSVSYLFDRVGTIVLSPPALSEDQVLEIVLEAGAEDLQTQPDGSIELRVSAGQLPTAVEVFDRGNLVYTSADIVQSPSVTVILDAGLAEKIGAFLEALEALADAQAVYCNAEFPDSDGGAAPCL